MRQETGFFDVYKETLDKLDGNGILLVAGDPPNPMTIGWGTLGVIWQKQVMTVMVRPTRHTYSLMEEARDFSVCILPDDYIHELNVCGTRSGRDSDKIQLTGFTPERCLKADAWFLEESAIHFECHTIHKHRLDPSTLDPKILNRYYPLKDFHMVYYGEIMGIYRK